MVQVDVVRLVAATSVLAFAAATDLKWRRAPDASWLVLGGVGVAVLALEWATTPDYLSLYMPHLVVAALLFVVATVGLFTGLFTGGADAKALMALAVLFPVPLGPGWTVPLPSQFPLVLTVLMNALLVALTVPLFMGLYNLARGHVSGLHTFLGVPRHRDRLDPRTDWPLEYFDEQGEHVRKLSPRSIELDAFDPTDFAERDIDYIWITPKVPFLVPLFAGVVLAMLVGDPASWAIARVVG